MGSSSTCTRGAAVTRLTMLLCVAFPGSDKPALEKTDVSPKFSKPHSKERVVKEREREGGGGGGGGGGGSGGGGGKFSVWQKWLRGDDKCHGEKKSSPGR